MSGPPSTDPTRPRAEHLLGFLRPSRGAPQRYALGILLFALSILVQWLDGALTPWMAQACQAATRPIWCVVADLGLVKLGLGSLWAALFASGLFYLVLYDWLQGFLAGVSNRAIEAAINIRSIAVDRIRSAQMGREDLRALNDAIYGHSQGPTERLGREFGQFVFDGACNRRFPVWRSDYTSDISIERLSDPALAGTYFLWDEKRSYRLTRAGTGPTKYLIKAASITEADKADLPAMIEAFSFRCTVSGARTRVTELEAAAKAAVCASLVAGAAWEQGPFRFSYAQGELTFEYEQEIDVELDEIVVTTQEESFLRQTDTQYVQSMYGPVHGMKFWFKVPEGYAVEECHGSPEDFMWEPGRPSFHGSARATGRKAEVMANGWVLPGIACVVIWKPMKGTTILSDTPDDRPD